MAKLFLRSGSLDAVLPIGENGHPLYQSALQLREALRLKKQHHIADCLAVPQPNDAGDRLDWYSPVTGKVNSWVGASENDRRHATSRLRACQLAVAEICYKAQQSEKNNQKLFGALLAGVLQFPDQNFVYLVGGQPVLTFWGFVSLKKPSRQDPLDCLRTQEEEDALPLNLPTPAVSAVTATAAVVPFLLSTPAKVAGPEPETTTIPEARVNIAVTASKVTTTVTASRPKNSQSRYGWMLPAAALLLAFGVQLIDYLPQSASVKTVGQLEMKVPPPVAVETTQAALPVTPVTSKAPATAITLPLAVASVTPVPAAVATVPTIVNETPLAPALPPVPVGRPAAKDDLVLPSAQVKRGSTKFLNGRWRVIVAGKPPITGRNTSLHYQLSNGKGSANIVKGNGVSCHIAVNAGLMKSGNLVIKTSKTGRCSDGSHYQIPELLCRQGTIGAAVCSGYYNASTVLPVTIKRESKK